MEVRNSLCFLLIFIGLFIFMKNSSDQADWQKRANELVENLPDFFSEEWIGLQSNFEKFIEKGLKILEYIFQVPKHEFEKSSKWFGYTEPRKW